MEHRDSAGFDRFGCMFESIGGGSSERYEQIPWPYPPRIVLNPSDFNITSRVSFGSYVLAIRSKEADTIE